MDPGQAFKLKLTGIGSYVESKPGSVDQDTNPGGELQWRIFNESYECCIKSNRPLLNQIFRAQVQGTHILCSMHANEQIFFEC